LQGIKNLKEHIFCGYNSELFHIFELNKHSILSYSIIFLCEISLALGEPNLNNEISYDEYSKVQHEIYEKGTNFNYDPLNKILFFSNECFWEKFYILVSSRNYLYWLCKNKQNQLVSLMTLVNFFYRSMKMFNL